MRPKPATLSLLLGLLPLAGCIIHVSGKDIDWDDDGRHSARWPHASGRAKVTELRTLEAFDRVAVEGGMQVEVRVGAPQSLWMRGPREELEHVETRLEDGILAIGVDEAGRREGLSLAEVEIELGAPDLTEVALSGSGRVLVEGVGGDGLQVRLSGSGDLAVRGAVRSVEVALSGSGDIDLSGLAAQEARVTLSGSGDVNVQVSGQLDARISGSGDVRYAGAPEVVSRVSGSGSVRRY